MKTVNIIIDRIVLVCIIIIILLGIYNILDVYYIHHVGSNDLYKRFQPTAEDSASYIEVGEDCVGWINIKDTPIDFPIMQANNNIKYLNTAPNGDYSLSGSIFLDCLCSPNFDDGYSLIYGHHMAEKMMFGGLDDFANEDYFLSHRDAELTFSEEIHDYKTFAYMITDANDDEIFKPNMRSARQVEHIKEKAIFFLEEPNGQIVALSTCKTPGTTQRIILFLYSR